ncbi:hypothetical protein [Micromonospora sp. S4605]|uniref:hypothetical protein n=1 Tax=Micromonospora sp. S4605 TaxID=1420897 RepID=UPI001E471423|nr:hypothetical protein [Micromonospora sp. S4605]
MELREQPFSKGRAALGLRAHRWRFTARPAGKSLEDAGARGMDADRASPSGGTRDVKIGGINDEDWYAGTTREVKNFNGPGGQVVNRQTNEPWASPATASRTINGDTVTARFNRIAVTRSYTTLDAGRVTKVVKSFDSNGMTTQVDDLGEESVAGYEKCTKSEYNPRNVGSWIMDRVHSSKTFAVECADADGTLTDEVSSVNFARPTTHRCSAQHRTGVCRRERRRCPPGTAVRRRS